MIVKLVLQEPGSDEARRIVRESAEEGALLYTPTHAHAESLNAVWKQAHQKHLTLKQAREATRDLETIMSELNSTPTLTDAPEALELSLKHDTSIYDTLYIAAAQRLNATLLTADKHQHQTAKPRIKTTLIE